MGNKVFYAIIAILVIGFTGFVVVKNNNTRPATRLGQQQPDKGRQHLEAGATYPYGTNFPTSGPHSAQPAPWGEYKQELPNETVVHNMEHGGIVVTYSSSLPKDSVTKLERLFTKPFSNPKFIPSKAIVMPGSKNDKPIIIRSWNRIMKLDSFNEKTLIDYYLTNVNKSPEPAAS